MKKIISFSFVFFSLLLLAACGAKTAETVNNLKAAADSEVLASAKYAAYAEKAKEEGYFAIAALFEATSVAEAIHSSNHVGELSRMGIEYTPVLADFEVGTTLENLRDAKASEEYEFDVMYHEFMDIAKKENLDGAFDTFMWANHAEIKHAYFYEEVIRLLENGLMDEEHTAVWMICPNCGDTYKAQDVGNNCEICDFPTTDFFLFK